MNTTQSIKGLGSKNNNLRIAARQSQGDILFDLTGDSLGAKDPVTACHDISVEQAEEIVAALQGAIADVREVKARKAAEAERLEVEAQAAENARRQKAIDYIDKTLHEALCGRVPGYGYLDLFGKHESTAQAVFEALVDGREPA